MRDQQDQPQVLVVDADAADVLLTCEVLSEIAPGAEVHTVSGGEQALAFLQRNGEYNGAPRPSLVVLDINLPGGEGMDVLRRVKMGVDLRLTPVVVLAAPEMPEDMQSAYDLHANCCVPKPPAPEQLRAVLHETLRFWFETVRLPVS